MCFCKSFNQYNYKEERVDYRIWAPDSQQKLPRRPEVLYTILFKFFLFSEIIWSWAEHNCRKSIAYKNENLGKEDVGIW